MKTTDMPSIFRPVGVAVCLGLALAGAPRMQGADAACSLCTTGSSDPAAAADGPPADQELTTEWCPADRRRPLQNLSATYTNQDGRTGRFAELLDRPVLVTFFYTRCENVSKCSATVAHLAGLQQRLAAAGLEHRVRLLAVTYEPQFDTPERLHRYGSDRGLRFGPHVLALQLQAGHHQRFVDELCAPVSYSSEWVSAHGVELSLLDASGAVVKKYHTLLWSHDEVAADVARLLAEGT